MGGDSIAVRQSTAIISRSFWQTTGRIFTAARYGLTNDCWRFTAASCARLFGDVFGAEQVSVRSQGHVLAAIAFLAGMDYEKLPSRKLDARDQYCPVTIAVAAVKRLNDQRVGCV